jgi:hypothetical protein
MATVYGWVSAAYCKHRFWAARTSHCARVWDAYDEPLVNVSFSVSKIDDQGIRQLSLQSATPLDHVIGINVNPALMRP